jgi:diketogulonate reductase-like aldo/keto reductase
MRDKAFAVSVADLLLLHHTAPYDEEAYKAMEDAVQLPQ